MSDRKIVYLDDAIDVAKDWYDGLICGSFRGLEKRLKSLPSAQPSGKDPIEREAVVEILHEAMQNRSESEEDLIGEIVCKVDLLPSTKPEIIRCKDCKYWREHKYTPYCGFNVIYTKADDFCSRAERREE